MAAVNSRFGPGGAEGHAGTGSLFLRMVLCTIEAKQYAWVIRLTWPIGIAVSGWDEGISHLSRGRTFSPTFGSRVVGNFPDGRSALMLVAARLRHIAGTKWGSRQYLDMERLRQQAWEEASACTA